jgi:Ca2+-transporting ATPase
LRKHFLEANERLAGMGLRVLAFAVKTQDSEGKKPYEDLDFLGLIGLLDPPREKAGDAIAGGAKAGIRTIMVTGDQPVTARNIALSVGLTDKSDALVLHGSELEKTGSVSAKERERRLKANIFARISPEQKLDLVELHQNNGAVVAMTGDGVNDAPALKKADIGIAMGQRSTQVAREASDMILKDNSFNSIVVAVEQGRAIFDNIRKFILFLLSGNVGEIIIVSAAIMAGARLPLFPLQILYLNMIGDVFPALALGLGKGDASKMQRPPRKTDEPILTASHWLAIMGYGALIAASVLAVYAAGNKYFQMEYEHSVTVSFLALAFARLLHTFNMRDPGSHLIVNDVTRNPFVWGALALCAFLLIFAVYAPPMAAILKLRDPGHTGWMLILSASLLPLLVGQIAKIRR